VGEPLGGGVDGEEDAALLGRRLALAGDHGELAGLHLPAVEELDRAGEEEEVALVDHPLQVRLAGPGALHHPGGVAHHRLEDAQPAPRGQHAAGHHAADDGGVHPRRERGDAGDGGGVFVAVRRVVEHVARGEQPQLLQQRGAAGPHPFQKLNGALEGERVVRHPDVRGI
jgi:hypothetical protein